MQDLAISAANLEIEPSFVFDRGLASLEIGSLEEVFKDLGRGSPAVAAVLKKLSIAIETGRGVQEAAESVVSQAAGVPYYNLSDYMERTWLREKRDDMVYAARVHKVKRSDHDRALHDHPWVNASVVLSGGYWEVRSGIFQACIEKNFYGRWAGPVELPASCDLIMSEVMALNELIKSRPASDLIEPQIGLLAEYGVRWLGPMDVVRRDAGSLHRLIVPFGTEAWSLFIMRPKIREWGFLGLDAWEHNIDYVEKFGKEA